VPWPYQVDTGSDIFGWPYAVVPRVDGTSAEQAFGGNHRAAHDPGFARAAGEALGRLHSVPMAACGTYELLSDELKPLNESYAAHVASVVRTLIDQCRAASAATTDADVEWVESLLERASAAMATPFAPSVIHLDYAPGNVVGLAADGGWEVTGIVDWMTAEAGDGETDLSRMLSLYAGDVSRAAPFIAGYRSVQPVRGGFEERFRVYMLLDRLWLWEYGQRNGIWFSPEITMRPWIEPFTVIRVPEAS
jgi:hygromycin-B 7''-O-kinase